MRRRTTISPYLIRVVLLAVAFVMVVISAVFMNQLARKLGAEEQKRMEIWAGATRELITAAPDADIEFFLTIIENNTTIPVYMCDSAGNYLMSRNVDVPSKYDVLESDSQSVDEEERNRLQSQLAAFYAKRLDALREVQEPIEVRLDDGVVQYIYYEDSKLLTRLKYFPYVNFTLIFLFFVLAMLLVFTVQDAEQDRVWAGLSKETAHQLGTPISSLNAWREILRTEYPDDKMIPEMDKDVKRLTVIADRFSKVGSRPELIDGDVLPVLTETVEYMRRRMSGKVDMSVHNQTDATHAQFNPALLGWVIENLIRNAVDAMGGEGSIVIEVGGDQRVLTLDVQDSGKGIVRRDWRRVFLPGFTTKERGWGMGLSLCRRIIGDYHHGKIYVLRSQIGAGTTFRIELRRN